MRIAMMAACAGALAACSWPVAPPVPLPPAAAPSAPALAAQGRYAEAVALLEAEARRQPSATLLGELGYAYYLDGRLADALAAMERACLAEPGNAQAWERLAALREAAGDSGRALAAMRHARTLREAGAAAAPAPARPAQEAPPGAGLWPAGLARVEVRQVSAGLVEVTRIPAPSAPQAAPEPARPPAHAQRLEISNGNGVRGMAAAVAQRLRAQGMHVVRLTNTLPFNVEQTRVEIRGNGEPQLRIVLGRDLLAAAPQIKKPPAVSRRQAP
ncbi:MAG: hypothetical protein K0R43_3254 [Pseudoduganella sp.]|nr:hypothetical protein [Pseudoduganella sp.]